MSDRQLPGLCELLSLTSPLRSCCHCKQSRGTGVCCLLPYEACSRLLQTQGLHTHRRCAAELQPGRGRAYERETKTPKRIAKRRAELDSEGYQVRRRSLHCQTFPAPAPFLQPMAGCLWDVSRLRPVVGHRLPHNCVHHLFPFHDEGAQVVSRCRRIGPLCMYLPCRISIRFKV